MHRSLQAFYAIVTAFDFLLAASLLALFSSAYPDRFRTALWQDGGTRGLNSDPRLRVYFYANYREPPPIPLIWDETLTWCNFCIAVFTMIVWIVRFYIRGRIRDKYSMATINALYDGLLVALWMYSVVLQGSGDLTDKEHISEKPWYLEYGCDGAGKKCRTGCKAMRATYGLSMFAMVWFAFRFLVTCMYGAYLLGREEAMARATPDPHLKDTYSMLDNAPASLL